MWTFGAIVQYFSDIGIFLTFDPWFVDNCGHKIRVSIILKTTAPPQKGTPANRTSIHTGISLNDYNKEIASLHISPRKVQKKQIIPFDDVICCCERIDLGGNVII